MAHEFSLKDLIKIDENIYEIPKSFRSDMRVPARIFMNAQMFADIKGDRSLEQLVNVATLPGIQKYAFAMPDMHQGYGFPIGGVAATAINQGGVISPGGIGYDINCGVRLLAVNMSADELAPYLSELATRIFHKVPSGVGKGGKLDFKAGALDKILRDGAQHMLKLGYGNEGDLEFCEERGRLDNADPSMVSEQAKKRGADQLGTLGSGNHFLEIQKVDEIFDENVARVFGLEKNQVTVMIHCGSRGLGHQTCTDYVRTMMHKVNQWGYVLPDRELVCAPFTSKEGQEYFAAMSAAANFAWANRHMIGHWVREAFHEVVGQSIQVRTVYDVSHNIGKLETHMIDDKLVDVVMHRKGATRAFGPGRPELPALYRNVGQPVLIPGTMGTSSYVLVGTQEGMDASFGSSCHGAGRKMSRTQAKHTVHGAQLRKELEQAGIMIRSNSDPGLAEEAPVAYKDIDTVVSVVDGAKLARKVARVLPLAVIKGD
ncbi:MAG: RtcB family protein [Candidatus Dependentiae bacterium]|nr:RtcB family protein [Candidatus Dependentiae bacterium]